MHYNSFSLRARAYEIPIARKENSLTSLLCPHYTHSPINAESASNLTLPPLLPFSLYPSPLCISPLLFHSWRTKLMLYSPHDLVGQILQLGWHWLWLAGNPGNACLLKSVKGEMLVKQGWHPSSVNHVISDLWTKLNVSPAKIMQVYDLRVHCIRM